MKKILLLLFVINSISLSQTIFNVDFDARRFSESDSTGRIELYYSFYYDNMNSLTKNNESYVNGTLSIKISSATSVTNKSARSLRLNRTASTCPPMPGSVFSTS